MEVRLRPIFGGDGTRLGIFVLNDTGSSTLTILETDLGHLGNIDNYYGWCYDVYVTVANGTVERLHSLWVEVRFVRTQILLNHRRTPSLDSLFPPRDLICHFDKLQNWRWRRRSECIVAIKRLVVTIARDNDGED